MKIGKVPETALKRAVLNQIEHRRDEVLVGPGIGEDCSVLAVEKEDAFILSTDPDFRVEGATVLHRPDHRNRS